MSWRGGHRNKMLVLGALVVSTVAGLGYVALQAIGQPPSAAPSTRAQPATPPPPEAAATPERIAAPSTSPTPIPQTVGHSHLTAAQALPPGLAGSNGQPASSTTTDNAVSIASWHLPRAVAARGTEAASGSAASNWRHTFGAERTTAAWRSRGPAGFSADIITLQGVSDMTDARRLFPARTHHVLLSRQVLSTPMRKDGTVALVIARRSGIKTVGIRHFLPDSRDADVAAALAVRFKARGGLFWVVSVESPKRAVRAALHAWLQDVAKDGTPVIFGGSVPDGLLPAGAESYKPASSCKRGAPMLAATRNSNVAPGSQPLTTVLMRFGTVAVAAGERPCAIVGRLVAVTTGRRD